VTSRLLALLVLAILVRPAAAQYPPELKGHKELVYGVAFTPDGKTLATAGFDHEVKLWSFP
jgi:WD40 repeat protein